MSECNCIIKRDGDDGTVCNTESPDGQLCSKPEGHDGPHAACTVAEHPARVWGGDEQSELVTDGSGLTDTEAADDIEEVAR